MGGVFAVSRCVVMKGGRVSLVATACCGAALCRGWAVDLRRHSRMHLCLRSEAL